MIREMTSELMFHVALYPYFGLERKLKNALNLPMIQDVVLVGAKSRLKFSRLVLLEDKMS